jgi:hypothetical protein
MHVVDAVQRLFAGQHRASDGWFDRGEWGTSRAGKASEKGSAAVMGGWHAVDSGDVSLGSGPDEDRP